MARWCSDNIRWWNARHRLLNTVPADLTTGTWKIQKVLLIT